MLIEIDGVVNEVPVPNKVPPVEASYQFKVPALAVALNTTVPASQRDAGVVLLTVGVIFIVASTAVREEVQPEAVAST